MTRKTANSKGKRSIFINLDRYVKILKDNSNKQRKRIKKYIKYIWSII